MMKYPKQEDLNSSNCTERSIKIHYPDFYKYIIENYNECECWSEKLYWFYNDLKERPKCPICGNITKFQNFCQGYREFCSNKCLSKSTDIKSRRKQTVLKKYGVDNVFKSTTIKNKQKKTVLERYGVDNVFKSDVIKEKIKITNIEKFGVEYPMQSQIVRDKSKQTYTDKYGVEHNTSCTTIKDKIKNTCQERYGGIGFQSPVIRDKSKQTIRNKYNVDNVWDIAGYRERAVSNLRDKSIQNHERLIGYTGDGLWIMSCSNKQCSLCEKKQYITYSQREYDRVKSGIETCTILNPINSNSSNLETFVRNILNELNITFETNKVGLLDSKLELDIYIPSKNIAIECNGVYWHSDVCRYKSYHYNKFKKCQEKGIQLISIWEDQIINKPDIVKSIILSKLNIYDKRLYARECTIKELSSKECNNFLDSYHLQGKTNSSVRLGLYHDDELVGVMTFGKGRKCLNSKANYELYRYCCKTGIQVVGGASRLFKYFVDNFYPESIESFSSNDISNGNLYKNLGFEQVSQSISYWYVDKNMNRYHRYKFTKHSLVNEGFDRNKTEFEIMNERGFYRIYDSGQTKWIKTF